MNFEHNKPQSTSNLWSKILRKHFFSGYFRLAFQHSFKCNKYKLHKNNNLEIKNQPRIFLLQFDTVALIKLVYIALHNLFVCLPIFITYFTTFYLTIFPIICNQCSMFYYVQYFIVQTTYLLHGTTTLQFSYTCFPLEANKSHPCKYITYKGPYTFK